MAEFALNNNYFEFDRSVYQQVSGTAIDTLWNDLKLVFWKQTLKAY